MITKQRHNLMLEMIRDKKTVSISQLAKELGISNVTARRDVEFLEKQSKNVIRIRGGAEWKADLPDYSTKDLNDRFQQQYEKNRLEKQQIARKASSLIEQNESVIIDAGSTTFHLAQSLDSQKRITAFLTAVNIAEALEEKENITKVLMGGIFRSRTTTIVSSVLKDSLSTLYADKVFIGVSGVSLEKGFTCHDLLEVEVKRMLARSAREVYWLADSSKINTIASFQVLDLESHHTIITDDKIESSILEQLRQRVNVMIAERR
ncbi:DeoR/GlpR family DNA-binding transcription regulator [Domibacillus indicus]|uniref:DeoR/GlpR family DNA-binding transcription regulator n=1 Tax=Domibacillus indicus TaxID=1437523 RepID=UPI002040C570|nr:DeoR/GlpR family DNA-binding transcription regulator [Domibacillus indicus]MCM3791208.1 DeoR/GlpR family DNA-binding transcription regulator [Domibacillus indicus]